MGFHGITGEQGEASNKRGVIGYSEWGSWQAGSSTQCDKSQYYGRSWQAGLDVAFCTWCLKTVLSPFGGEPPPFSEKARKT